MNDGLRGLAIRAYSKRSHTVIRRTAHVNPRSFEMQQNSQFSLDELAILILRVFAWLSLIGGLIGAFIYLGKV